jgi:hypothetical protein
LLVVVAIIGLLIAILLPSLSSSRAQARSTLCAARISQMTKSLFLYGDDFNELLPFNIIYGIMPGWGGGGNDFDPNEDWLAGKDQMPKVFLSNQEDWSSLGVDLPRSGSLFKYTRFPEVYACPDFIRRPENGLAKFTYYGQAVEGQRVFNYTRAAWCRRPTFDTSSGLRLEFDGPIMTVSKVYAPAQALMLMDEAWYANVGRGRRAEPGSYRACDPVWDVSSSLGLYHGSPWPGEAYFRNSAPPLRTDIGVKRGNTSSYDGHVELYRDPCPLVDCNSARLTIEILLLSKELPKLITGAVYALVGEAPPPGI